MNVNEKVTEYISALKDELEKVNGEIARMERTRSRIEEKLRSPEKHFNKELKRGAVRVKKIFGQPVPEKKSPFKKKSDVPGPVEIPTVEMDLPAPAPAAESSEEKKSSGFGFFKG